MSRFLSLVKLLAPMIIANLVPHGQEIAPFVSAGIEEAEALKAKGASKAERLAHARALVNNGINGYNAAAGHEKINPAAVNAVIDEAISTTVNVANIIDRAKAPQA